MPALPFALRRPWLLTRDLLVDRDHPDVDGLARMRDPEGFVWAILPHAARTFSACIAVLPGAAARVAAVGYLYCRILDTYEDLLPDLDERLAALAEFGARFESDLAHPTPARPLPEGLADDARDAAHLVLVNRCELVDRVHATFSPEAQQLVRDVVFDMAEGMAWGARTFAEQGELLTDDAQLLRYCRAVLGNPVVFATRLTRLHHTGSGDLTDAQHEDCMRAGEFIQLANVTRDIEKDLRRGVAFHPVLRDDLGADVPRPARDGTRPGGLDDAALARMDRVRAARTHMLDLALSRAGSYDAMAALFDTGSVSLSRASAVLMLLFTDRYYRGCATRGGRDAWGPRESGVSLLGSTLRSALSRAHGRRLLATRTARLVAESRHPDARPATA